MTYHIQKVRKALNLAATMAAVHNKPLLLADLQEARAHLDAIERGSRNLGDVQRYENAFIAERSGITDAMRGVRSQRQPTDRVSLEKCARILAVDRQQRPVRLCACLGAENGEPTCRCRMRSARQDAEVVLAAAGVPYGD